ncbi:MAG: hypothetical protein KDM81_17340, partial [Verrucomicrobiae bacterium]|nr:hypothetical protein [Verrucomicrobiae bacterium]
DVALVLPDTVVIPAGEAEATFEAIVADDDVIGLAREAELTALAEGHTLARTTVEIRDNDDPGLTVEVDPTTFSESAGGLAAMGRVTRAHVTPRSLVVQLQVSDDTEAVLLPQVLIRGGQASTEFFVSAVNDTLLDGDQTILLRAFVNDPGSSAPVAEAVPFDLTVTDDDGPSLRLALGGTLAREGRNPALTGVVTRNSTPDEPLTVALVSDDLTEATVPAEVIIPAGETSATFPVATLEDGVVDGNQRVTLTATAEGYSPAVRQFTVSDGDLPDLVVSELAVPSSGLTRDLFQLSYRITNQGFDTTGGSPLQRVVLSRDPVLDADDRVIDETPFAVNLPPGQSFSRELSLFLPGETGNWWVFVTTDADDVVNETLEDNNTARSGAPLRVDAAYTATVQTDINSAPAGTLIPLHGSAMRPDGQPAAGELVNIHVIVRDARRILSALTDLNGRFTANFQPLPSEGGTYTIGAVHPGVNTAPVQDTFSILALRVTPN